VPAGSISIPAFGVGAIVNAAQPATKIHNYHTSGAIFTGLNPLSTFVIDVVWIVEMFPGPAETDLLVLATPSCGFDFFALQLLDHVLSEMPVAVKAGENFAGDWFSAIVDKVAEWAGPVGAALGTIVPGAGAIGAGLSAGAKLMQGSRVPPPNAYIQNNSAPRQQLAASGMTKSKRKRLGKKNTALAAGSRGRKNNIQGPLMKKV